MKKTITRNSNENGSVIVWIFIAVGLFAAVGFAMNYNSRGSTNLITGVQAEAYASEIISYGNDIKSAVKRLELRGCSDTEISFENTVDTDYTNGSSPSNESCHVFSSNGGGVVAKLPNSSHLDTSLSGRVGYGLFRVNGDNAIQDVATTCGNSSCSELAFFVTQLKSEVCIAINNSLGIGSGTIPTDEDLDIGNEFTGSYVAGQIIGNIDANIAGRKSGCFYEGSSSEGNQYFHVLIAR